MKIVITYASAGTGHRRAAEAIYNYFKENCTASDLKIIDALQKTNFIFRKLYGYGYIFLVNHALWLWHFCFWITSLRAIRQITAALVFIINRLNTRNFADFLIKEKPDFIISTHFLSSEITAYLKNTNKLNSRLISVVTDFGVHPFWVLRGTDMYIAASDSTKEELIFKGVEAARIKDLGIPIDSAFSVKREKGIMRRKLGIDPDKFTVLISTGSFGIGRIEEIVQSLCSETQLLVVCAHNRALYSKLKSGNYAGVKVFGFIENMQELMAASDMIITKPGGLTIAESLAMDLFAVFIAAIPGQETENAKILMRKSIGIYIKNTALIKDIVLDLKEHPDKLRSAKDKIGEFKRPLAVKELCNVLCKDSIGPAR